MTRNDIIRMAREASEETNWKPALGNEHVVEFLERFAALVAAAERDRTARLVADMQFELQALRDRQLRQKPRIWVRKPNCTNAAWRGGTHEAKNPSRIQPSRFRTCTRQTRGRHRGPRLADMGVRRQDLRTLPKFLHNVETEVQRTRGEKE